MIIGHGNDWYDVKGQIIGDFSSNIPYLNNSNVIIKYLSGRIGSIKNYPDPEAKKLTKLIADHHNVPEDCVLVTNGSTEAFYQIAQLFYKKHSLVIYPAFAEYKDAAVAFSHKISFTTTQELKIQPLITQDLLWYATPNNPDGHITYNDDLRKIADINFKAHIVIDYAYSFLYPNLEFNHLKEGKKNVIAIHSLTKTFAIPGIRLGYILADKNIIEALKHKRIPWSIGSIALDTGEFIMKNFSDLLPPVDELIIQSKQLQEQIKCIHKIDVIPSECNFFIAQLHKGSATQLKQFLLNKYKLLIRDASNFKGLSERYFRVSVQKQEHNKLLIKGLTDYLSSL